MTGPAPRHDQVAELTHGVRLPLVPIADDHLEILAEGLRQAFDDLRTRESATMTTGKEPELTALMQARLNSLVDVDPLWRQLVLWVGRGVESISFDGSHLPECRQTWGRLSRSSDRRGPRLDCPRAAFPSTCAESVGAFHWKSAAGHRRVLLDPVLQRADARTRRRQSPGTGRCSRRSLPDRLACAERRPGDRQRSHLPGQVTDITARNTPVGRSGGRDSTPPWRATTGARRSWRCGHAQLAGGSAGSSAPFAARAR